MIRTFYNLIKCNIPMNVNEQAFSRPMFLAEVLTNDIISANTVHRINLSFDTQLAYLRDHI